ncbi:MAG TPA: YciI family protein [Polyangiales bacterium]|nr:YciI family protein [Polyangiales bacterium]
MRFLITAQPNPNDPSPPAAFDPELFKRYMAFNEEMHRAGILLASEGLNPGGQGAHAIVRNGERVAVDGPFAESKELVGGFYLIEVPSLKEALAWAAKAPCGMGFDDILEVRPLTGVGDIPPELVELIKAVAPSWSATFV